MTALEVHQARKSYGDVQALNGVDLTVAAGEFFGLLGPNGAGKTTLIQSIVGLCRLSSGRVSVFGHDVVKDYMTTRRLIGYSPQEVNLDRFFSIQKILEYQAGFFGVPLAQQRRKVGELLERFDLTEKSGTQYYKLSGGMQKRVLVAKALVNAPKILILDEPTAGVDVQQRHDLWNYLRQLNGDGTTIILTTHYIDEAEALCERIGIINLGEIREMGAPRELIRKYCRTALRVTASDTLNATLFADIRDYSIAVFGSSVTAEGAGAGVMIEGVVSRILKQPAMTVKDVALADGSLEEVFLKVTGSRLVE